MLFWLKKVISFWLLPVGLCTGLMVAGWVLMRSTRRQRLGRALLTAGLALLIVFTNKAVSRWLIRPLEASYPPIAEFAPAQAVPPRLAACRYIVVLGGGHGDAPGFASTTKLSPAGLGRLVEAVRLARAVPAATIIVSGPSDGQGATHASVLAQAAESLGIDRQRIRQIDTARDTEDEAQAVQTIAGHAPVALVTSAWHMRRATGLFRKAGADVLPCPADFQAKPNPDFRWNDYSWDSESLTRSTCAVREYIGYLWVWLRGKV